MIWQASETFYSTKSVSLSVEKTSNFDVIEGINRFCCQFVPLHGADCLYVSLRSYKVYPDEKLPYFSRTNWGPALRGHVLAVSDPTSLLVESLILGCFLGRHDQDPIPGLIAIAESVAQQLGVPKSRIVYWGSSSSAFGAGMAAIRSEGSHAVLFNPVLHVPTFKNTEVGQGILEAFDGGTFDEVFSKYPLRMSVTRALLEILPQHETPNILVAQNTVDRRFHVLQFQPFLKILQDLKETGRELHNIRTVQYSHPDGHLMERAFMARRIPQSNFPIPFSDNASEDIDLSLDSRVALQPRRRYGLGLNEPVPWILAETGFERERSTGRFTEGHESTLDFRVDDDVVWTEVELLLSSDLVQRGAPVEVKVSLRGTSLDVWTVPDAPAPRASFRFEVERIEATTYRLRIVKHEPPRSDVVDEPTPKPDGPTLFLFGLTLT